jgi:lysophospholipase L1-like esterase
VRSPRLGLRRTAALAAVVVVGAALTAAPASATTNTSAPAPAKTKAATFDDYLALGDSLGAGWQPNATTGVGYISGKGYADDIAAGLKAANPKLNYVNLACPGETTGSMIHGGCPYPETYKDQLDAATQFLKAHRGDKVLVTIDIGANDIDSCASAAGLDINCAIKGLGQTASDVPQIMAKLRASAGRKTEFIGSTYYNPFLADYLTGTAGQGVAKEAAAFSDVYNGVLAAEYSVFGAHVADVAKAFSSDDFTTQVPLFPGFNVPLNVARICQWTWMCAPAPVGPNIHANDAGYAVMASTFEGVITPVK